MCLIVSAEVSSDTVDSDYLLVERELYIAFEVGAAANSSGLDTSMALVNRFMLRGENLPTKGIRYRFSACSGCP